MRAKPEYRDRDETEVAVLDALAERNGNGDGMTVLAIRSAVDADIDTLEDALGNLKSDALIEVTTENGRTVISVEDHVVGPDDRDSGNDLFDQLRDRFSL